MSNVVLIAASKEKNCLLFMFSTEMFFKEIVATPAAAFS